MRRCLVSGALAIGVVTGFASGALAAPPDSTDPDGSVPPVSIPDDSEPNDELPAEPIQDDVGIVSGGTGGDTTTVTLPLIPVPIGCEAPLLPHIVFIGTPVDRDFRTVRFEIEQIRSGRLDPFAAGGQIDVRYGLDVQYLADGERYLVSAVVDPDLGLLVSRVSEPIENFGGDEVIGVSETDIDCPEYEDAARTLHTDGTPIDAPLLEPFFSARLRLLTALVIPFAVALAMVFALSALRLSISGVFRSLTGSGRS